MGDGERESELLGHIDLTLCEEPDRGRFVQAVRPIRAGQEVLTGVPAYLTAILPTHRKRVCANCLVDGRTRLTVTCAGCKYTHYCSVACRDAHAQGSTQQPPSPQAPTPSPQGSQEPTPPWRVQPVAHTALCPVMKQFSSFKLDADMQAILLMCAEHAARLRSTPHHTHDTLTLPAHNGTEREQHTGGADQPADTANGVAVTEGIDGTSMGMHEEGKGMWLRPSDFDLLCEHMEDLPGKQQKEWLRGARFLIGAMERAGWSEPLPTEDDIMDWCGRILANSFGIFSSPTPHKHTNQPTPTTPPTPSSTDATVSNLSSTLANTQLTDATISVGSQQGDNNSPLQDATGSEARQVVCSGERAECVSDSGGSESGSEGTCDGLSEGGGEGGLNGGGEGAGGTGREALMGRQVFINASFFNHSCDPNAVIAKNVRPTDPLRVVAARDIRAGEEVNISYIDVDVPRSSRQITLKKAYNFTCCCARCEREAVHGSEERTTWRRSAQTPGSIAAAARSRQSAADKKMHKKAGGGRKDKGGGQRGGDRKGRRD